MSALSDFVTARWSATRLKGFTNPDNPDATTINTTILGQACDDATNDFPTFVNQAYDETDAQHVLTASRGVRAYLVYYMDQGEGQKLIDRYHDELERLAQIKGRNRLMPATNSLLVPTVEGLDGRTRPAFDNSSFDGVNLDNPANSSGSQWNLD